MHRKLKLQHHRHTGKVLSHHHTSYRALGLILLCATFVVVGAQWCLRQPVGADMLSVTATVPAPLPTEASTITDPADGSTSTTAVIDVRGNCQILTPPTTVAIYDNDLLKGSAPCGPDGTYSAQITLIPGANSLKTRTVTITGGYGPDGSASLVTYLPPEPPKPEMPPNTPANTPGSAPAQPLQPLSVAGPDPYILMNPGKGIIWSGSFGGGNPPYTITIDWGDGTTDVYHNSDGSTQDYGHTYHEYGSYTMTVTVRDKDGNEATATFSVMSVIAPPPISGGTIITTNPPNGTNIPPSTLLAIYGGYLTAVASLGLIWLHAHAAGYAYAGVRHLGARQLFKSKWFRSR